LIPARQLELERQRLGRELHTGLGQLLSAIRLQLDLIARQMSDPAPGIRQALDRIGTLSAEALDLVRSISRRLHPPAWQGFPLETALRQLWEVSGITESFESSLTVDALPRQPSQDAKVLLYRAAQEAISNVIRHSHASRVSASLSLIGEDLLLRFEDNGVGFDAATLLAAPANLTAGIGLRTIREQAEALGGMLRIESGSGGVKLEVAVGLSAEQG
jgi:two-component system NarL family sensor kinase